MQILSGPQKNRGGQMIIIGTYIVAHWTEDEIWKFTVDMRLLGEPLASRRKARENKYKVLVVI